MSAARRFFPTDSRTTAVVNEPSAFEPLKIYCRYHSDAWTPPVKFFNCHSVVPKIYADRGAFNKAVYQILDVRGGWGSHWFCLDTLQGKRSYALNES